MTVTLYPPLRYKKGSHPFDGAQYQTGARPMPSDAQATTPATKGTSVKTSSGRGLAVLKRNDPGHSHYQMTLRPSDSTMAGTPTIKESSVEVSCEKGLSCTSERKRSKATKSPLAMARRALARAQDAFITA